jgi:hypothetical protein
MRARDLLNKLHDEPFQPFRVRLSNNTSIDVLDPTPSSSAPAAPSCRSRRCATAAPATTSSPAGAPSRLSHMVEFVDIDPPKPRPARKRAS